MNSLGSSREQAENKLILLYLLDRINMPVSNLQVTKLILKNSFMNYFLLQQYLKELCESGMLTSTTENGKTFYGITESGKKTLDRLLSLIPSGIKVRIDNSIPAIRNSIRNETMVTADFRIEDAKGFIVRCAVREDNFTLFELEAAVGTKNNARQICENWKKHSSAIYSEIIESLTKKRD